MSVADTYTARGEMLSLLWDAWRVGSASKGLKLLFWDKKEDPPGSLQSFGRVTVQHIDGRQATLSGEQGRQSFDHEGTITVQIFTKYGQGLRDADALVKIVKDAYEGQRTPSGIWFRNVRVNEVGQNGDRFQTNVLIDFTYDIVK